MDIAERLLMATTTHLGQASARNRDRVSLDDLAPTQAEAGFAEVDERVKEYIHEAKLIAASDGRKVSDAVRLKDAITHVIARESSEGVKALIDPGYRVRVADGHHQILAVKKTVAQLGLYPKSVKWRVRIAKDDDFSDRSWEKFGQRLKELGIGGLTPAREAEAQRLGKSLGERAQMLPENFAGIVDSPMRSASSKIFRTLDLKGSAFNPDVQFAFGKALEKYGITVKSGEEFSPEVQGRIQALLFDSPHSSELQGILLNAGIGRNKKVVANALATAQARYLRVKAQIKSGDLDDALDDSEEFSNAKGVRAKTACVMQSLSRLLANQVLPNVIRLPSDPQTIKQAFEATQKEVQDLVDVSRSAKLVGQIADKDISGLSRADQKYIKAVRKAALKLRAAYRFLSASGDPPGSLDTFATEVGELDDTIGKWNEGRASDKELADIAKSLRTILTDHPDLFAKGFSPADSTTLANFEKTKLNEIKELLTRADNGKLTVDEYHKIRKDVRDFAALFNAFAGQNGDTTLDLTANMVSNLSHEMGEVKDGLLNSKMAAKIKNPGDKIAQIASETRQSLDKFVAMMNRSMP
jgi:hypothetical protein